MDEQVPMEKLKWKNKVYEMWKKESGHLEGIYEGCQGAQVSNEEGSGPLGIQSCKRDEGQQEGLL